MTTFVSAFVDLSALENNQKRRDPKSYLKHTQKLLSEDIFLYLFLEEDMAETVRNIRKEQGLQEKTFVQIIDFSKIFMYTYFDEIAQNRKNKTVVNANGTKDTAAYITLVNNKMAFVKEAIQHNPFDSTHFGWVDFGIYHVATPYQESPFLISSDLIKMQMLQPFAPDQMLIPERQYRKIEGRFSAGFITGSKDNWIRFIDVFYEELLGSIRAGYGPSEEQVFPVVVIKNPDLFAFYYGNYESILCNYQHQTILFGYCNYYLRKCKRLNYGQGREMSLLFFEHIEAGFGKPEDGNHLSSILGFLNQAAIYHPEMRPRVHQVFLRLRKEYAFFRSLQPNLFK